MMPAGGYSASSSASSGPAQGGSIGGSTFSTGHFGTGTDIAGILREGMVPIVVIGLVLMLWMARKKKK